MCKPVGRVGVSHPTPASGVGTLRVGRLVAMAVDLEDDAERIFDIAHAIGFLAGVIFADRHPLLTASRHDLFDQAFNVGVLDAEVEGGEAKIAFNAKYLMDVLGVIGTDNVALEVTTPSSPGVIRPSNTEDYIHVIMPMFVQW